MTIRRALLLAAASCVIPFTHLRAQAAIVNDAARARLDATLRHFVDTGAVAGISALIYEKGHEVYFDALGMADREAGRPMARNTIVQIYSMTKPITGVALMQLYEQGKFQLDDPVAKYLPELAGMKVAEGVDPDGAPILVAPHRAMTIRDVTRHTSGIASDGKNEAVARLMRAADPFNYNNTLTQAMQKLATVPLWFHPGEKWAYGTSVNVQAALVERLSGEPFDLYVKRHVV